MSNKLTRRTLLKAGPLAAMLVMHPTLVAAQSAKKPARKLQWKNWGGNLISHPSAIKAPKSEQEVIDLITSTTGTIRPVGSGHSWSGLVPTDQLIMTLDRVKGVISHDADSMQADVWAGTKLSALGPLLEERGQALQNMSDIDYQTMAGAVATSTHGTGSNLGSLSSYVSGLRLITPSGEAIDCSADSNAELFHAATTSLGSLGVITRLRFQNRETHRLHQQEWLADLDETLENIEELDNNNQQFELFPLPNSNRAIVVVTNLAKDDEQDIIENDPTALDTLKDVFSFTNKIPGIDEFLYNQALDWGFGDTGHRIGTSYKVLAHPRTTLFMEMEYTVPRDKGVACLREVMAKIKELAPHVCFPLEFRYVKADDTMVGMFSERDGCSISIHEFSNVPNWQDYLKQIEPIFHKYEGRPHWGKWHSQTEADFAKMYPRWNEFKAIRKDIDPEGRMLNEHLKLVFGEA